MEYSKAKIVGFVTIIVILVLLGLLAMKIVSINKERQKEQAGMVTYKDDVISVSLNGDVLEYVSLGEEYIEDGVEAIEDDEDISSNVIISYFKNDVEVASIDTSSLGSYLVKYTIMGISKNKSVYKTVIVMDDKRPVISFPKDTTIKIDEVLNFDLEDNVLVSDNSGDAKLTYEGKLEEKVGSYVITYKAVDSSGNKTVKKRLIKVIN